MGPAAAPPFPRTHLVCSVVPPRVREPRRVSARTKILVGAAALGGALGWAVPLGGLAATAAVAWLVARRARRALAELEGER